MQPAAEVGRSEGGRCCRTGTGSCLDWRRQSNGEARVEARLGRPFEQRDRGRVLPGPLCWRCGRLWRRPDLPVRTVGLDPGRGLLGNLSWAGQRRCGGAASAARLRVRPWQLRCGGRCRQDGGSVVKCRRQGTCANQMVTSDKSLFDSPPVWIIWRQYINGCMNVLQRNTKDATSALVTVTGPDCSANFTWRTRDVRSGHGYASAAEPENCMKRSQEVATSC